MKRLFPREVLRFVDSWACHEGTPEDEEDARAARAHEASVDDHINNAFMAYPNRTCTASDDDGKATSSVHVQMPSSTTAHAATREGRLPGEDDWVELDVFENSNADEELGRMKGGASSMIR